MFVYFEIGSHSVAQIDLELKVSCLHLQVLGLKGVYHHGRLNFSFDYYTMY